VANSAEFLELLRDHLSPLGTIRTGRMFSGTGIYCDGVMLRVRIGRYTLPEGWRGDPRRFHGAFAWPFFHHTRSGRTVPTSYCRAPEELLDDPDEWVAWARAALAAARSTQNKKPKRGRASANLW